MSNRISKTVSRKRLAIVWFCGAGILFVILLFQSFFGFYAGRLKEAWAWFLPNFFPTLTLIVSVLVGEAGQKNAKSQTVDSSLFWLASGLSFIYILVAALTILLAPFSDQTPLQLMAMSTLWLGPLQGLVTAAMGAFFVAKKTD